MLFVGCEIESSELVARDLDALAEQAVHGVDGIREALEAPEALSRTLGAGVEEVSKATRGMSRIATSPEIGSEQRLSASVQEARAWDDVTRLLEGAELRDPTSPELEQLYHELLREKAFPARIAARNAYDRALRMACRLASAEHPVALEALDGIERYGGEVPVSEQPCSVP